MAETRIFSSEEEFVSAFVDIIQTSLLRASIKDEILTIWDDPTQDKRIRKLPQQIIQLCELAEKPVVLMIDEVDKSTNNQMFLDFLGMLRDMYLNRNEGIAKGFLYEVLQMIKDELPKTTINSWYYFAAICLNLNYGKWLLDMLQEDGFDRILSPYFVALQALEIERKENKAKAEIYLKNRAVEISEPARMIIEKMRKYIN